MKQINFSIPDNVVIDITTTCVDTTNLDLKDTSIWESDRRLFFKVNTVTALADIITVLDNIFNTENDERVKLSTKGYCLYVPLRQNEEYDSDNKVLITKVTKTITL